MTTPIMTFEVLCGFDPETGHQYKLEIIRDVDSQRSRCAYIRTRTSPADAWSPRVLLEQLPWNEGGPVPPSIS